MTYARRPARRAALRSSRRLSTPRRQRRILLSEPLEMRALLAADWLVSDFWNGTRPADVNADGSVSPLDALLVVNELNSVGSHSVMGPAATSGSGEGETSGGGLTDRMFRDTNNDGTVSPIDALLVFNQLNAEGETALMRYQIQLFQAGTNTPLGASIPKGSDFDFVVTVKDDRVGGRGVFAGYLDVNYDSSLTRPRVSEIQHIVLDGNPTGGSFTLTFGGQTTAAIPFSDLLSGTTLRNNIRTALENLSNINPGDVDVTFDPIAASGGQPAVPLRWGVRFTGQYLDQNVGDLTITTNLTGGTLPPNASGHIDQTAQGVVTDPVAFREAFRSRIIPGVVDFDQVFYTNALNAGNVVNKIDDLGAVATGSQPFPFTDPAELVRARMTATDAGTIVFMPDLSSIVTPAHDTLIYDRNTALSTMEINIGTNVVLTITENVSATPDTINITEDSTGISFNPLLAGGGTPAPVPAQPGILADVNSTGSGTLVLRNFTQPANGTVTRIGTSDRLTYVPSGNFSGTDTFTYTIGVGASGGPTDTATVTVNVAGINDRPSIAVQGGLSKSTSEDTPLILSSGNGSAITVADIDANGGNETVTLNATNGTLTMGSTTNLTVTGNGTAALSVTGTIADINAGLNGLVFTPTPDVPTSGLTAAGTIVVNINDNGNSGTGGPLSPLTPTTINITINATNDAPVNNNVPAAANVDEGSVLPFAISVSDVDAASGTVLVTLTVTAGTGTLNVVAPAAPPTPPTINGNNSATLTLSGTLASINPTLASLKFTPTTGFLGASTFTITTNDNGNTGSGGAKTDIDTTAISVDPTVRPRARPDTFPFQEGVTPYRMNVMQNDVGNLVGAGPATFPTTLEQIISQPASGGHVVIVDAGVPGDKTDDRIDFIPDDPNFFGTVTFSYGIWDTASTPPATLPANAIAQVTVVISNTNDPPDAVDDAVTTPEDTPINISVLAANPTTPDSDPDNNFGTPQDTLTATIATNPAHGSVQTLAGNVFRYTPAQDYNGPDSFTYTLSDGKGGTDTATVSITVTPVNDNPIAVNDPTNPNDPLYRPTEDSFTFNGTFLTVAAPGVLGNDSDPDNVGGSPFAGLTPEVVAQPLHGTLVLNPDGSFTYTPTTPNFDGTDTFTYRDRDGDNGLSNTATVTLRYNPVNDAPVAQDDLNYSMTEDTTLNVPVATGLLANDTDVDSPTITVSLPVFVDATNAAKIQTLTVNPNGSFTLIPAQDFTGDIFFTYQATDGPALSNIATVKVSVLEFNDPPTVNPDSASVNEDDSVLIDVTDNDTDPENNPLSLILATAPLHGDVVIVGNQFQYTPDPDYFGPDSFRYRVNDGQNTAPLPAVLGALVSITVNEVNDAPVAVNDGSVATPILAVKNFVDQEISVLGNDFDPDNNDGLPGNNDTIRVFQVNGSTGPVATTAGGTVRVDVSGKILYTPAANYEGPDSFTYTVADSRTSGLGPVPGISNSATVTLNVVDFVPKTVGGVIFIDGGFTQGSTVVGANNGQFDFVDANHNSTFDPGEIGEKRVMGAEVRIQGTSFQDTVVDLTTHTDMDGKYSFPNLVPPKEGTFYVVTEVTPLYLVDGLDSPLDAQDASSGSPVAGLIFDNGNDSFRLAWAITDQLGDITLRFGERGIDAGAVSANGGDSRGIITDLLASSSNTGFVLTADSDGDFIWSWTLPGWENAKTLNILLDAGNASATLSGTDRAGNPFSIRIHQNPALNTESNYSLSSSPNVTGPYGPRFRLLGTSGSGDDLIRIDGTAADFGLNLLAAIQPAAEAEGEGPSNVNPEFARAADELFGGQDWA